MPTLLLFFLHMFQVWVNQYWLVLMTYFCLTPPSSELARGHRGWWENMVFFTVLKKIWSVCHQRPQNLQSLSFIPLKLFPERELFPNLPVAHFLKVWPNFFSPFTLIRCNVFYQLVENHKKDSFLLIRNNSGF